MLELILWLAFVLAAIPVAVILAVVWAYLSREYRGEECLES